MNDFDYDVFQKKRTAASARKKKNGSRSKYCGLPSDMLTKSQLKKLNGKVVSYNMKAPMKWKQFISMPADLQKDYLNGLIQSFEVSQQQVAEMFGVHPCTLSRWLGGAKLGVEFQRGSRMSKNDKLAWAVFLNPQQQTEQAPETTAAEGPQAKPEESPDIQKDRQAPCEPAQNTVKPREQAAIRFSINFKEAIDPNLVTDVMNILRCIPNLTIESFNVDVGKNIPF